MSYEEADAQRELEDCEKRIAVLREEAAKLPSDKKLTAENDLKKAAFTLDTVQDGVSNNKLSSNGKYEISNLQRDLDKIENQVCGSSLDANACMDFVAAVNAARSNPKSLIDDLETDLKK